MPRIAIVGTGLLGRLMALALADNHELTLFDRDGDVSIKSCSYTGAGMLAPYCELEAAEMLISELGVQSLPLWERILDKLSSPVFFQKAGSLVVAHPSDRPELLRLEKQVLSKLEDREMMCGVNSHQIAELEPEINKFSSGLYFPNEGQISNRELLNALANEIHAKKIEWLRSDLNDKALKDLDDTFEWVIDCRGLGAKDRLSTLRGVRGELIHLHCPEVRINRPVRLMHPRYPIYIVPRPNNRYIIGATQIESEDFSEISLQSTLELLSAAYTVHSGFAEARIIESSVNCRPAFPDNQPSIDIDDSIISINGLYRHGFLISPVLVEMVKSYINEEPSDYSYWLELLLKVK